MRIDLSRTGDKTTTCLSLTRDIRKRKKVGADYGRYQRTAALQCSPCRPETGDTERPERDQTDENPQSLLSAEDSGVLYPMWRLFSVDRYAFWPGRRRACEERVRGMNVQRGVRTTRPGERREAGK